MSSTIKSWMPAKGGASKYQKLVVSMSSGLSLFSCNKGLLEKKTVVGKRERLLLATFIENAGAVVSTQELMHRVWPGRALSGNTLAVNVYRLKQTLRCLGVEHSIQQLNSNGYRFKSDAITCIYNGCEIMIHADS